MSACVLCRLTINRKSAPAAGSVCLCSVLQVGSVNNTFGVKGVQEYCQFFKSIEDANALRRRISECFERAALPYVSASAAAVMHSGSSSSSQCIAQAHQRVL
jgi:hypothetical protein